MTLSQSQINALYEPFPASDHEIREGHFTNNGDGCVWHTYIRRNAIQLRLDALFPGAWSNEVVGEPRRYDDGTITITMSLTVDGITRTSNGSDKAQSKRDSTDLDYENAEKAAMTDAFKRAASMWGIGLYLQDSPFVWTKADWKDGNRTDYDKKTAREKEAMDKVSQWLKMLGTPVNNSEIEEQLEAKRRIALLGEIHRNINTLIGADVQVSEIKRLAGLEVWSLDEIKAKHPNRSGTEKFAKLVADRWEAEQPKAEPVGNGGGNHIEDTANGVAPEPDPKAEFSDSHMKDTSNSATNGDGSKAAPEPSPITTPNGGRIGETKPMFSPTAAMTNTPEIEEVTGCFRKWSHIQKIVKGVTMNWIQLEGNVLASETGQDETYGEVLSIQLSNLDELRDLGIVASDADFNNIQSSGRLDECLYGVATRTGVGKSGFAYKPGTLSPSRAVAEAAASADEGILF